MATLSGAPDASLSAPAAGAGGAGGNASQLGLLQALIGLLGGGTAAPAAPAPAQSNLLGLLRAMPPSASTASPGFDPASLGRFIGPLGKTVGSVGRLAGMPGVSDVGTGITGLGGLFNLGQGIASGNASEALGGGLQAATAAGQLAGIPGIGAVTGPLSAIPGLIKGNPLGLVGALPSTLTGLSSVLSEAMPALSGALGTIGSVAALPVAIAVGSITNAMDLAAQRKKAIASEIRRGQRNVPVVMGQMARGAQVNPATDPLGAYTTAMQAIAGSAQIADPFGKSGKTKSVSGPFGSGRDMKLPDYSQQIALFNQLMPSVMANLIQGEQALAQGQTLQPGTNAPGTIGNPRPESYQPISIQGQDVTLMTPEQIFDWAMPYWLNGAQAPAGLQTDPTVYTTQYTPGQDQGALAYTDQPTYVGTQANYRPDLQADLAALDPKNLTVGLRDILTKYLGPSTSPFATMLGAG